MLCMISVRAKIYEREALRLRMALEEEENLHYYIQT